MSLIFDGKKTKVQQLAEYIQDAIATNELKVGEKLPSINHLSRQFSVSRDTVFKSLSDLRARGMIDAIHGKNYYVASHTKTSCFCWMNIPLLKRPYTIYLYRAYLSRTKLIFGFTNTTNIYSITSYMIPLAGITNIWS